MLVAAYCLLLAHPTPAFAALGDSKEREPNPVNKVGGPISFFQGVLKVEQGTKLDEETKAVDSTQG